MRVASFLVIVLTSLAAIAESATLELKGINLGDTKKQIVAKHKGLVCQPNSCTHLNYGHPHTTVPTLDTFASEHVKTWHFLFSKTGILESSRITMERVDSAHLLSILIEKYGSPQSRRTSEFKTVMGVKVAQVTADWKAGDTELTFTSPDSMITESTLDLTSASARTRRLKEFEQKIKKDM